MRQKNQIYEDPAMEVCILKEDIITLSGSGTGGPWEDEFDDMFS